MESKDKGKDRIKGTIIAGACGDAFGMPYEGLKKHQIVEYYGTVTAKYRDSEYSYHTKGLAKGSYTDDTQLTLATIEAILDFDFEEEVARHWGELSDHVSNQILAEKIGHYFVKLYKNKQLIGAGRATKLALKEALKGTSPVKSGLKDAYGCGAAMRISPIALMPLEDLSDQGRSLLELTCLVVQITHNSTVGLNSAFLVSSMIKNLLRTDNDEALDVEEWLNLASNMASDFDDDTEFSVAGKIRENAPYIHESVDTLADRINTSGLATESVVLALFAFLKEPEDFEQLMISCVRNGGDTDSIASIAGNFFGALNGFSAIPMKYVINLQNSQKMQKRVDEFVEYTNGLTIEQTLSFSLSVIVARRRCAGVVGLHQASGTQPQALTVKP